MDAIKPLSQKWSQFRTHSIQYDVYNHKRKTLLVFENVEAKAGQRQQEMEQLWVRSAEKNSVIFGLHRHAFLGPPFLDALHDQYPEAIEIDSKHGHHNVIGVVAQSIHLLQRIETENKTQL
ncbi:hypothetical protein BJV82DRAFT_670645 [Fennellomyces sp. T-0311]|nr:hypothetical protein BJV82DRAFT_670645 [Fennellomyces sp. T-0311]